MLVNDWMLNAFSDCSAFESVAPIQPTKCDAESGCGYGRLMKLEKPISIEEACEVIKAHFGLKFGKFVFQNLLGSL